MRRSWPKNPLVYEINTWVWLGELGRKRARQIDLGQVPDAEWDHLAGLGFDAVWLMGVWQRSPFGISVALNNETLMADFKQALPDMTPEDVVGSPYCIRNYRVDERLGGEEGLATARRKLAERDMMLILDFVPNHVAPDHPWTQDHPDYFIAASHEDRERDPKSFLQIDDHVYACGKDPFFPAWPDVVQLNAFSPEMRAAATETVRSIAAKADGVRCDMAMLLINDIFARTWGDAAGNRPATEYWRDLISAVRQEAEGFLFIAEAYWDLEWELQQQGFDFCYDKRLYDRLHDSDVPAARAHLLGDPSYQQKMVRFTENHDEPRAATAFAGPRNQAAAAIAGTLPGVRLYHEGQFEGRKVRLPVFLDRRPDEPVDETLRTFYQDLMREISHPSYRDGNWSPCETSGWPDNGSFQNILAWTWSQGEQRRRLIAVNFSEGPAQAMIRLPWTEMAGHRWILSDPVAGVSFDRQGDDMRDHGLYVDLPPWSFHILRVTEDASVATPLAA